jgi:putative hydrolase of HD superfamily
MEQLNQKIAFIREADRLKAILRRTSIGDRSRNENSAEHSWHLTLMVLVLESDLPSSLDIHHVVRMLIVHDLVEIDAGDTFAFDAVGHADKAERERVAADRIFGLLPDPLTGQLRTLWEEFEAGASPEARVAVALDRFGALLQNTQQDDGGTWRSHGISRNAVMRRMDPIREGVPALWPYVIETIDRCVARGHIS